MRLYSVAAFALVIVAAAGCSARTSPTSANALRAFSDADWLAGEPVICGKVRGRVRDASTGAPMADAYVTVDSIDRGARTDSLGQFRITVSLFEPGKPGRMRATLVQIRRIGFLELKVHLPAHLGYVVEADLASQAVHADHVSTLRIKTPGSCALPPNER